MNIRLRNLWIAAAATPFVIGGLLTVLVVPYNGWPNVLSTIFPLVVGTKTIVPVCSSMLRRDRFDYRDVAGFALVALVTLATIIGCFAVIYRQLGLSGTEGITHDPWVCLYFSVITWTTVGYGDFAPAPNSRPFAALEAMVGYVCMALLTAVVIQIVTKFERPATVSGADLIGAGEQS